MAVGELIVNKVINQEPVFESLRKECGSNKTPRRSHKRNVENEMEDDGTCLN